VDETKSKQLLNDLLRESKLSKKADIELLTKAFEFSQKAHEGQNRLSGDPYFVHPYEAAKILASIGSDPKTIATGLLHDTVEDAGVSKEDLEKEFGKEITFLVEGVTKLGKLKYRGAKRHSESLRKLFVAMSQDIRVIVVKLADRLANMHTLQFVPKEKQRRIAEETMEIYAPIAYRLGIGVVKKQLEDLAFLFVMPDEYRKVKELLKLKHKDSQKKLEKIRRTLRKVLAEENVKIIRTNYRLKGLFSLYRKLKKHDWDVDRVYDVSALRIIVNEVDDCYKVLGIIHGIWKPLPGRIKDYIALPKINGYRSIHTTIFTGDGGVAEIQIRTEKMHMEAEFGIASHFAYKGDAKDSQENSGLRWIAKLIPLKINWGKENRNSNWQFGPTNTTQIETPKWVKDLVKVQSSTDDEEMFLENIKTDFFKERVFVFTPEGDVLDLPIDSTPIDFAYAIHSDIGNHIFGSKINGKLVSLDTKLKNGDIIEIQTQKNYHPTEKWLKVVKTSTAQKQIKSELERLKHKIR